MLGFLLLHNNKQSYREQKKVSADEAEMLDVSVAYIPVKGVVIRIFFDDDYFTHGAIGNANSNEVYTAYQQCC